MRPRRSGARPPARHRLTSPDGVRWQEQGRLDVRMTSGEPLSPGPYGTPTVWGEDGTWYLFYERNDEGVWLATSRDRKVWRNVSDDPVIPLGPEAYDRHAVALNQVVRYEGRYYGVYRANADAKWKGPWTTCLALSDDLVTWRKYPGNPVIRSDDSRHPGGRRGAAAPLHHAPRGQAVAAARREAPRR